MIRRILGALLLILLGAAPAWSAVTVDAVMTGGNSSDGDSQQGDNVASISSTGITLGSSTSCLIATLVMQGAGASDTVTMTWNGVTMTERASVTVTGGAVVRSTIWSLVNPATGNHTLQATWTNLADVYLSAVSFIGTDTTTCVQAADNTTATNTTAIAVSSTTDGATVAIFGADGGVPTMNQTKIWDNAPFDPGGGGTYAIGGTSNSHTFTGAGGTAQALAGVHIISGSADTQAPTDPTSLAATAAGSSQIDLTWTASTDDVGVTAYRVERCTGSGCVNFAEITSVATNAHTDQSLASSTLYRYRVRAQDAAVNLSGYSNIAEATTAAGGDTQAPTQPSGLSAFAGGANGIDLGWGISTDNIGVTAYRIERCAGSGCVSFVEIAQTTTELTYADRGLTADTLYRYRVRAQDAIPNFSTYATITEARTRTTSPTISWTDNSSDETGFIISRRSQCGSGSFTDVATVDANITKWSDTTTQSGEMEYRVRATNSGGDSANTGTVCWSKERRTGIQFSGRDKTTQPAGLRQR